MAEGIYKNAVKKPASHAGHRNRLRRRLIESGFGVVPPLLVLETVLFYAIPRRDTQPLARRLLERFGTLKGVLDASLEELMTVEGVGETTALLLKTVSQLLYLYEGDRKTKKANCFDRQIWGRYLIDHYLEYDHEEVYAAFFNDDLVFLGEMVVYSGDINSAGFSLRGVVKELERLGARYVLLAHNHPEGPAIASLDDLDTNRDIRDYLYECGAELLEHFVVYGNRFTCMERRK